MTLEVKRIHHPTDLSRKSEFAYCHALRLALAAGADLDIVHVDRDAHVMRWENFPSVDETLELWGLAAGGDGPDVRVERIAAYGREPVRPILAHLDEFPADLIVLASHRRSGLDRWLHREIGPKLTRSRSVPTLFVPEGTEGFVSPSKGTVVLRRVLLPVDWSPSPQDAVDAAADLARLLKCSELELTLLHVSENTDDLPAVNLPAAAGWRWTERTVAGEVVETVLSEAEVRDCDLIVMASQGHDGFLDALRGSTTERVLRQSPCPVLVVPVLVVPGSPV